MDGKNKTCEHSPHDPSNPLLPLEGGWPFNGAKSQGILKGVVAEAAAAFSLVFRQVTAEIGRSLTS